MNNKPRFKVIGDYPGQAFKIGDILHVCDTVEECEKFKGTGIAVLNDDHHLEKYPVLFHPMEWYEDRLLEEMPEFVKVIQLGGDTYENTERVLKDMKAHGSWAMLFTMYSIRTIEPATKEEYEQYMKSREKE